MSEPAKYYIEHESYFDGDGVAYFGPVPEGTEDDVLATPEADWWAQSGNVEMVDDAYIASLEVGYVNPWSVWLDPDSDAGDDVSRPSPHGQQPYPETTDVAAHDSERHDLLDPDDPVVLGCVWCQS